MENADKLQRALPIGTAAAVAPLDHQIVCCSRLLQPLVAGSVASATADSEGMLRIALDDGARLIVAPDPQFEAWTVAGPDGFKVVCGPGGELSSWSAL